MTTKTPRILILDADYYTHISAMLRTGAEAALAEAGAIVDTVTVPGVLEIPSAVAMASAPDARRHYDGYVLIGCVIRGETSHYDIVANESARAVLSLAVERKLALGNAILTVETEAQAIVRADPAQKNKGADAARAALRLIELAEHFGPAFR